MNLKNKIESILFVSDRPVALSSLEKFLDVPAEEIETAISELEAERKNTGIVLLRNKDSFLFSTNPENSELVKDFLNTELREKLTDASLETLAIIAYKQPVSRGEIEAIRGVNSQYTLRLLMMRGLIEKAPSKTRMNYYQTTHEFLQHLGLQNTSELPNFEELTSQINPPQGYENVTN